MNVAVTEPAAEIVVEIAVGAETASVDLDNAVGSVVGVAVTEAAVAAMIRVAGSPAESAPATAAVAQSEALAYLREIQMNSVRKDRALLELRVWYRSKSTTLLIEPL